LAKELATESRQNPQAGKPALRSADILVGGFWGLSSPQSRTVSSCALGNIDHFGPGIEFLNYPSFNLSGYK
jgi:hypothetical protein